MKEIKFRAWDKKNKKWIGKSHLEYLCVDSDVVVLVTYAPNNNGGYDSVECRQLTNPEVDSLEIVQFTGLKDKNGKEIYEGDILKLEHGSITMIGYVKASDSGEWILYKDEGNYLSVHGNIDRIEVIGNIYEHTELLTPSTIQI